MKEFFEPRGIAVVGASREPGKLGHEILRNIIESGFQGGIYPVNPKADEILGLKCYTSVSEIPVEIDLAIIVVPAKFVARVVEECGRRGIKAAVVISGGFREIGPEGERLEEELVKTAKEYGVRIIGPNCQGVNSPPARLCASWPLVKLEGPISVISQSGTVFAALGCWAESEGIGVSRQISLGNKSDVDEADLLEYLANDEKTRVVALYMEGVRNGRRFLKAMQNVTSKKPVVVLKGGRTEKGAQAALSHTRTLAGLDQVFDVAFRKAGAIRVYSVEELYDCCKALALLPLPQGPRTVIVTSSGGCGILATDTCEEAGLEVVELAQEIIEKLKQRLPPQCIFKNPLDLTGSATTQMYDEALEILLASEGVDSVIAIVGDPMPGIAEVVEKHLKRGKPVVTVMLGGGVVEENERTLFARKRIPVFSDPVRGAKALAAMWEYAKRKCYNHWGRGG
jgi:acetyl coenzyme A synthetase (ADP forming)-like protein